MYKLYSILFIAIIIVGYFKLHNLFGQVSAAQQGGGVCSTINALRRVRVNQLYAIHVVYCYRHIAYLNSELLLLLPSRRH